MHVISSLKHGNAAQKTNWTAHFSVLSESIQHRSLEIVQVIEYIFTNLTQMNLPAVAGGCGQQQRLGSYASSNSHLNRLEIEKRRRKEKRGSS